MSVEVKDDGFERGSLRSSREVRRPCDTTASQEKHDPPISVTSMTTKANVNI